MVEIRCGQGVYKITFPLRTGFISAAGGRQFPEVRDSPVHCPTIGAFFMFCVYVLYNREKKKHYTGYTTNLAERMYSHNYAGNDWTAGYRPWKLIYTKEFGSKQEAIKYEKWLKSGVGREFIKSLPH